MQLYAVYDSGHPLDVYQEVLAPILRRLPVVANA